MTENQCKDVVEYLKGDFTLALRADIVAILRFHKMLDFGGDLSIPRQVFCYIDYLGSLCYGPGPRNNTRHAIKFIENYFGEIDERYKKFGELMYNMWRHGTVHEFDPKRYIHSSRKYRMGWRSSKSSDQKERNRHLKCFMMEVQQDNCPDSYVISINLFELVDHLKQALRKFIEILEGNPTQKRKVQTNYRKISKAVLIKWSNIKRHEVSSREKVDLQLLKAVKNCSGIVDESFEVISDDCQ
jgi:hypothetical protein